MKRNKSIVIINNQGYFMVCNPVKTTVLKDCQPL